MSTSLVVVLLLSSLQLVRVASFRLSISPDHVRKSRGPESVTFTCSADTALTGCQIRWWYNYDKAGPLLEMSRGSESQANSTHLNTEVTGYSYSGRGLAAGDCGVSLQVEGVKWWMVTCRVRAETGGWTYAWADLNAHSLQQLPNTRTPRESVVLPGGEARFTWKAQEPLRRCRFYPPGLSLYFDQGAQSPNSTGRHRYLGGGLGGGECGLALTNVSEADNGPVRGYVRNTAGPKSDSRFMALIVARSPGPPALRVVYTVAGVTATCVVHEGRPVANITWVLGDVVLRHDSLDDHPGNPQDEWRWPWMQASILQRLTLGRQANYNGKVLKCVSSHVALARPLEATEIISFTAKPSRQLEITPTHVRVNKSLNHVTITCKTDTPLTGCQFSWRGLSAPQLDLSRTKPRQEDAQLNNSGVLGYRYSGRGLAAGECGVELDVQGPKEWLFACRVRAQEGGGWLYKMSQFFADSYEKLPGFAVSPELTVVLPGEDVHIMCRLESPMKYCVFRTPGGDNHNFYGSSPWSPSARHSYYGRGLAERECGLKIVNITERDNGLTTCYTGPDHWIRVGGSEQAYTVVIVARPPSPPRLTFSYEGNQITATCTVQRSRPAASIAWTVDGEVVRWDSKDDGPAGDNAPWGWPWRDQSTTQTLVLTLEPTHQGKTLSCRAVNHASPIDRAASASTLLNYTGEE